MILLPHHLHQPQIEFFVTSQVLVWVEYWIVIPIRKSF